MNTLLKRAGFCLMTTFIAASASAMERGRDRSGAVAGAVCPAEGSCFESHGTPGCDDASCCQTVCAIDAFCCETSWDTVCVGEAESLCQCGGDQTGSCFSNDGTPFCEDAECCEQVCAIDSYCCSVSWDGICVGEAEDLCLCGGELTGSCFESHNAAFCNDADCCEQVCAIDSYCCSVSWDSICVGEAEDLCLCGGELTGSCFSSDGTPFCDDAACCELVCGTDSFCCSVTWDSLCVDEAEELCLGCGGVSSGSCFEPDGTPDCNDETCCNLVCEVDAFCCDTAWDSLCVDEAFDLCVCGGDETGDCFTSDGSTFCQNAGCCEAVCAVDSFCCTVTWDNLCVEEAFDLCTGCGGAGTPGCLTPHNQPGCANEDCCDAVCAVDSFCCSVEWDEICVDEALDLCQGCGAPGSGSCFATDGTPGCNDTTSCQKVCAADPFCCQTSWDGLCVNAANQLCNCPADLDGSGSVDGADLGLLLGAWDTAGPGDLNGSGFVDGGDLGLLLGAWGDC
jgi:hypothetical protein